MRTAPVITLTARQERDLRAMANGRRAQVRQARRARIVLLAAQGMQSDKIAAKLAVNPKTVLLARRRFAQGGLKALEKDAPRGGRPAVKRDALTQKIIEATLHEKPPHATHWTTRTLARHLGLTQSMAHRVWRDHGLKPHLQRGFKLSRDKHFVEKLRDVVGLYLNPPEHALVLAADEKSQIQALDRTQPGLPMKKGRMATATHDYKRNGTTTLFAALELAEGKVIATCMQRHRHQEWLKFLKQIDAETPPDLDLHIIQDNYSTHKHAKVKAWLARHPRFHMHFIPTSSSWLNMVERLFRDLTVQLIRRGVFPGVEKLIADIMAWVGARNENPRPYRWTARTEDILAKIERARTALHNSATA